jgi:hypothetical protein
VRTKPCQIQKGVTGKRSDGGDVTEAAVAFATALVFAEEKEGEGYYLIPKEGCRECGKRLPLKVKKTKYKNEAVLNKVKLV